MVNDWYFTITGKHKVTVHAMNCKVGGNCELPCNKTVSNHGTAVNATRPWRPPEWPGICIHVLRGTKLENFQSMRPGYIRDQCDSKLLALMNSQWRILTHQLEEGLYLLDSLAPLSKIKVRPSRISNVCMANSTLR